jgi:hypothetical protein
MSNNLVESNVHGDQYDAKRIPGCLHLHIETKTISIGTAKDIPYPDRPLWKGKILPST